MGGTIDKRKATPRSFMGALRRDIRGNTLAIMAAALIPLAGMVGSGIDVARLYMTKTRLQHACDAGALAGRKAMGGGVWSQNSGFPNATAQRFFNANFAQNSYGSTDTSADFSENAGRVTGTARATLPMTLTRVIGFSTQTITVACDAEMRLPNTDVMFVLDNTGSMGSPAISSDSQTKIEALKSSVKCFYEILARLDTDEDCIGGAPSGGTGGQVQIRFGFMPYAMNVNVGRLLPSNWFADRWTYQSRKVVNISGRLLSTDDVKPDVAWTDKTATTTTEATCQAKGQPSITTTSTGAVSNGKNESNGGLEGNGNFQTTQAWRDVENKFISWVAGPSGCKYQTRTVNFTRTFTYVRIADGTSGAPVFNAWHYSPVEFNISGLKSGTGWNASVAMPIGNSSSYGNTNVAWGGCIEERHTVPRSTYEPIPADADDLDIDAIPDAGDQNSLWGPALNGAVFYRHPSYVNASNQPWTTQEITTFTTFSGSGTFVSAEKPTNQVGKDYQCPLQAVKLQAWPNATDFDNYVDSMVPNGNTYHDIGLVWGARFLSPTGLFRSQNEFTPSGGEIQRNLIFMTDGDACTALQNYQAYGASFYDRRQTDPSIDPSDGCQTKFNGTLTQQVSARTAALCTAVKNKNITLWVIWFGVNVPSIETQLRTCATPGRFYAARNQADLQNTFRSIANQISQLRLTS